MPEIHVFDTGHYANNKKLFGHCLNDLHCTPHHLLFILINKQTIYFVGFLVFSQNDVIRTTKLALLRARLRRHCSQSRKAFKGNVHEQGSSKSATMSLIQSARESGKATVCVIKEKTHEPQPRVFR